MKLAVVNPRTGEADYTIEPLRGAEIATLAKSLREGQKAWAAQPAEVRATQLRSLADAIGRHRDALIAALTIDTGRAAISVIEVDSIVRTLVRWAQSAPELIRRYQPVGNPTAIPSITTTTRLAPYGLVGVISPWNFPLTLALIDAIPALAAGCAVLIKPSEVTPRFIRPLMQAIAEAPAIATVLAVIEGDGPTGAAMIEHVDFVAF